MRRYPKAVSQCSSQVKDTSPQKHSYSLTDCPENGIITTVHLCPLRSHSYTYLVKNTVKISLFIFFDIKGIVHKEFVLAGQTVNSASYCDVLWQLIEGPGMVYMRGRVVLQG
jgi:hypothetical protein